MFKKIIAALAALLAATAFAAVDANKATQAELEAVKGIGPTISAAIIAERKKSDFKDWNDLAARVKGIGEHNAAKFSEGGLTVGGKTFSGVTTTTSAMKPTTPAKATSEAAKETTGKHVKAEPKSAAASASAAKK